MSDFADFKRKSRSSSNLDELSKKIQATSEKKSYKDDRFWRPELDKASNGYAVIRFLPAPPNEDLPWAKLYTHGFQAKGGWFIENSRTTFGEKDPVSEMNSELWNSGTEADKDIARARKRKLQYISNILVISDPANPQNEGKIFLYKFGKKIFDKIQEAMEPEFADEKAVNPFELWDGANFKLKVRKISGFINYDKSEFDSPSALFDGDDTQLEELWKKQYSLTAFTDPSNFKSYDELKQRLMDVVGDDIRSNDGTSAPTIQETSDTLESKSESVAEETDALDYFERLAKD
tara:strand:+ start:2917 stop:3789 length:873 start_codon:yes stop_codon:yes gene_type:complete